MIINPIHAALVKGLGDRKHGRRLGQSSTVDCQCALLWLRHALLLSPTFYLGTVSILRLRVLEGLNPGERYRHIGDSQ